MNADLNEAYARAQEMREQVLAAQRQLDDLEITGTARGGAVSVRVSGSGEYRAVRIDPEVFEHGQGEAEAAVLDALRDLTRQLHEISERRMSGVQALIDDFTSGL